MRFLFITPLFGIDDFDLLIDEAKNRGNYIETKKISEIYSRYYYTDYDSYDVLLICINRFIDDSLLEACLITLRDKNVLKSHYCTAVLTNDVSSGKIRSLLREYGIEYDYLEQKR